MDLGECPGLFVSYALTNDKRASGLFATAGSNQHDDVRKYSNPNTLGETRTIEYQRNCVVNRKRSYVVEVAAMRRN
jgi:hypothetical protein